MGPLLHETPKPAAEMYNVNCPPSYVRGVVESTKVSILVDSGASLSLISEQFHMSLPALRSQPLRKNCVDCFAVNGQMLDTMIDGHMVVAHAVTTVKNEVIAAHVFNPSGATVELKQGLQMGELYC